MTTITMNLADDIVMQAKKVGVFDEKSLAEQLNQFLQLKIQEQQSHKNTNTVDKNWTDELEPLTKKYMGFAKPKSDLPIKTRFYNSLQDEKLAYLLEKHG